MHNFTFSSFLFGFSVSESVLSPATSLALRVRQLEPRVQGLAKWGLFKGPLTKTVVNIDPGSGPDVHRAGQIPAMQDLTSHHEYVHDAQRADSRDPKGEG